jgi:hypothetical protein
MRDRAVLARSFIQSVEYSRLITAANTLLEKALSPELVIDFRLAFFERRKRLAQALAAALPGTRVEEIFPLTLHIFTLVAGLWPFCHPSSESEKGFIHPELNDGKEAVGFVVREKKKQFLLYASGFSCNKKAQAMLWRIVVWVAVVEVLVCLVPFELTGIISLLHLWRICG